MPCLLHQISNTELLSETDDETLLISTLDGALHAITKSSGAHKWTLKDGINCCMLKACFYNFLRSQIQKK